jgi:hypothetical protein
MVGRRCPSQRRGLGHDHVCDAQDDQIQVMSDWPIRTVREHERRVYQPGEHALLRKTQAGISTSETGRRVIGRDRRGLVGQEAGGQ